MTTESGHFRAQWWIAYLGHTVMELAATRPATTAVLLLLSAALGTAAAQPREKVPRVVGGHQEARKFEPAGRAPWSGGRPRGPTRGLGDAASIALALDGEDLGVMDDAIDERGGRGGVGEDRRPLAERQVGGEHEALAFVAADRDPQAED